MCSLKDRIVHRDSYERYLTHACLMKVGGLELWRANLCLKFASSSWPWELLHWIECYLFRHLIHTQKWPLGAVFDKQTDWIACVSLCVVSPPRCPQGLSETAQIDSRTWKIAPPCPLTCPDYTSYYIDTLKHRQTYRIDQVQACLVQYLPSPHRRSDLLTFSKKKKNLLFLELPDHWMMLWMRLGRNKSKSFYRLLLRRKGGETLRIRIDPSLACFFMNLHKIWTTFTII